MPSKMASPPQCRREGILGGFSWWWQPFDNDRYAVGDCFVVGVPEKFVKVIISEHRRCPERTTSASTLVLAKPEELSTPKIEAGSGVGLVGGCSKADIGLATGMGIDVQKGVRPFVLQIGAVRLSDQRAVDVRDWGMLSASLINRDDVGRVALAHKTRW